MRPEIGHEGMTRLRERNAQRAIIASERRKLSVTGFHRPGSNVKTVEYQKQCLYEETARKSNPSALGSYFGVLRRSSELGYVHPIPPLFGSIERPFENDALQSAMAILCAKLSFLISGLRRV